MIRMPPKERTIEDTPEEAAKLRDTVFNALKGGGR